MHHESKKKIALGEAWADLAEAWFKLLGFVAITGVFHAAAAKTEQPALIAIKWVCYFLMFVWLQYKIDKATWFLFPTTDPTKKSAKSGHLSIALVVGFVISTNIYMILAATLEALLKVK